MNTTEEILNKLESVGGIICARDLSSWHYHILLEMVASGMVNRIGRGLYATDEALANTIYDVRKTHSRWCYMHLYNLGVLWAEYADSNDILCCRGKRTEIHTPWLSTDYVVSSEWGTATDWKYLFCDKRIRGWHFDIERCVCDALKYRNKIGMDVCSEILQTYIKMNGRNLNKLSKYAQRLRVGTLLHTYLEALLWNETDNKYGQVHKDEIVE